MRYSEFFKMIDEKTRQTGKTTLLANAIKEAQKNGKQFILVFPNLYMAKRAAKKFKIRTKALHQVLRYDKNFRSLDVPIVFDHSCSSFLLKLAETKEIGSFIGFKNLY